MEAGAEGAPKWMRYIVCGFFGCAMLDFAIFLLQAPQGGSGPSPPAAVWRGFSDHRMAFYSAALLVLYSAGRSRKSRMETPDAGTPGQSASAGQNGLVG